MHMIIVPLALSLALTIGCAAPERQAAIEQAGQQAEASSSNGYRNVPVEAARQLVDVTPGLIVLDVREPHEFAEGHIPGARNLPLGHLDAWAPTLDASKSYLVVCRSGARSTRASEQLAGRQFKGITNMTGGMLDWQRQGHPTQR